MRPSQVSSLRVALVGAVAVAVPSLQDGGEDRLTGQVAEQPPAAPADDGPALVVHITAGQDAAVADTGIQACLQGPGVTSRPVDGVEPTSYVVSAADNDELTLAETCLAAVDGVIVERSTETLAGRGPVPVATLPGGVPVYSDESQNALAAQLQERLRRLVETALPGVAEDGPVGSATTRTPTGPSRNLQGVVEWHDERGHVQFIVIRMERFDEPRVSACAASSSPSELGCAQVTPRGGGGPVTLFSGTQGDRNAVRVLNDGSGVTVMQLPQATVPAEQGSSNPFLRVTPRPTLPLSDGELAAMAVSLAR